MSARRPCPVDRAAAAEAAGEGADGGHDRGSRKPLAKRLAFPGVSHNGPQDRLLRPVDLSRCAVVQSPTGRTDPTTQHESHAAVYRPRKTPRPLLDPGQPDGFIRYPYYSVRDVATILTLSEDFVRRLFRAGKQGRVLEIYDFKRGKKRTYRTVLIPYVTLAAFLQRHTKER